MPLIQFNVNLVLICICWRHESSISMRIDGPCEWLVGRIFVVWYYSCLCISCDMPARVHGLAVFADCLAEWPG